MAAPLFSGAKSGMIGGKRDEASKGRPVKNGNHDGQPEISAVCNRHVVKQKRRYRAANPANVGDRPPPTEFVADDPRQQVRNDVAQEHVAE